MIDKKGSLVVAVAPGIYRLYLGTISFIINRDWLCRGEGSCVHRARRIRRQRAYDRMENEVRISLGDIS